VSKLLVWYCALSAVMLVMKTQGDASRAGNGADLIANVMALVLAQPWFSYYMATATDQDLVTFRMLLYPVLINVAVIVVVVIVRRQAGLWRKER
jgi:hypothetical protein